MQLGIGSIMEKNHAANKNKKITINTKSYSAIKKICEPSCLGAFVA
jgi:hypothetical protein